MSGIFISYRHQDSAVEAHNLFQYLAGHFGPGNVFIDVEAIQPGESFPEVIDEKVGFCNALLIVIGPNWINSVDADGRRRLDDPSDWVRLEIAAALARRITVIPVLVGAAAMPSRSQLPPALQALADCQAVHLRPDSFEPDAQPLLAVLQSVCKSPGPAGMWFNIITRRQNALDPLDFHRPETLGRALRFLVYMLIAEVVIHLPVAAQEYLQYWNPAYVMAYIGTNFVAYLFTASALHYSMKAGGGIANPRKTIAAFCYLSAYLPLIAICQVPAWGTHVLILEKASDIRWTVGSGIADLNRTVADLGGFGILRLLLSFLASSVVWLLFVTAIYQAFRTLHRMKNERALAFFGLGAAPVAVFLGVFFMPQMGALYRAFAVPVPDMTGDWAAEAGQRVAIQNTGNEIQVQMDGCVPQSKTYTGAFHAGTASLTYTPAKPGDMCDLPVDVANQLIRNFTYRFRARVRWEGSDRLELLLYTDDVTYDPNSHAVSAVTYSRRPDRLVLQRRRPALSRASAVESR